MAYSYNRILSDNKRGVRRWVQWLTPIILGAQEAEIRRITV
jgi:hypothetical protein